MHSATLKYFLFVFFSKRYALQEVSENNIGKKTAFTTFSSMRTNIHETINIILSVSKTGFKCYLTPKKLMFRKNTIKTKIPKYLSLLFALQSNYQSNNNRY